jgi:hypothetical protein
LYIGRLPEFAEMPTFGPTSISLKAVSLSVGTVDTFLGNLLDVFWHYCGDFDLFFLDRKFSRDIRTFSAIDILISSLVLPGLMLN